MHDSALCMYFHTANTSRHIPRRVQSPQFVTNPVIKHMYLVVVETVTLETSNQGGEALLHRSGSYTRTQRERDA